MPNTRSFAVARHRAWHLVIGGSYVHSAPFAQPARERCRCCRGLVGKRSRNNPSRASVRSASVDSPAESKVRCIALRGDHPAPADPGPVSVPAMQDFALHRPQQTTLTLPAPNCYPEPLLATLMLGLRVRTKQPTQVLNGAWRRDKASGHQPTRAPQRRGMARDGGWRVLLRCASIGPPSRSAPCSPLSSSG